MTPDLLKIRATMLVTNNLKRKFHLYIRDTGVKTGIEDGSIRPNLFPIAVLQI